MGLIQFALIANARVTLTNLSREGARYAAVHALESGSDTAIKNYVVTCRRLDTIKHYRRQRCDYLARIR